MKEIRVISNSKLRELCVENNLYTLGQKERNNSICRI